MGWSKNSSHRLGDDGLRRGKGILLRLTLFVVLTTAKAGLAQIVEPAPQPRGPDGWYVDLGPDLVTFDTKASLKLGGVDVPNTKIHASSNVTPRLNIGYYVTPYVSIVTALGLPPETTITGRGALSGLTLAKATYGAGLLAVNYHIRQFGAFQPFVGTGISYTMIFGTKDAAVTNFRANNAFGVVIRAGFDLMVSDHVGVFFNIEKIFVSTSARGNVSQTIPGIGGMPATANITLDPLIFHAGVTYRF